MIADDALLRAKAQEAARGIVDVYGDGCTDRRALANVIAKLVLAFLRCGVEASVRECERPTWCAQAKTYIARLARGLAVGVPEAVGVELTADQVIDLYQGFRDHITAVLGGVGSIAGAVVGGVLIGVIESMAGFYLPEGWKDVAPYIVLLIMLVVRTQGLFGTLGRKKV